MKKQTPTFVLALCIVTAIAGAPMAVLAKNLEDNTTAAIAIGQTGNYAMFGASNPLITDDTKYGLQQLVDFVGPIDKTFVVRNIAVYSPVRKTAIDNGVTTDERVAKTDIFGVEDALAACGLHMSAEQYARVRGLRMTMIDGTLPSEAELLTAVYKDLKPRIESGELNFKIVGATSGLS